MSTDEFEARLEAFRGDLPAVRPNARTVAAALDTPDCRRRRILEAASVDKSELARHLGHPIPAAQSPFALRRGNLFESAVKENGDAHLIAELRKQIDLPIPATRHKDLSSSRARTKGLKEMKLRAKETQAALSLLLSEDPYAPNVLDHAVTSLEVGGSTVYLEQDALAHYTGNKLYVVEIKSFPVINNQVDPVKLRPATRQAAVYILSLQQTLARMGHSPEKVATDAVLICPRNYDLTPTSATLDTRQELRGLRRQLDRAASVSELEALLPQGLTLSAADTEHCAEAVEQLPNAYRPACLDSGCELAYYCRSRARDAGETVALGTPVRQAFGPVDMIDDVLAMADSGIAPSRYEQDLAADLIHMQKLYRAAGGGAA
ncbi:hypothetical protein J1792_33065 [Streptomyces triculaminicus]|uniref:Secreted protein n=2 Tax=Streptomyces TaxID=1883 RepID=A0A939FWI2_9ACTN|nr:MULTISPECIES: hypothetical protein [Streptomyces]MBO0657370.1 hypothetical protein [Streptomyces triculaminicus]QSY49324.1 hypothetical protein J3S04_31050 [Streptomyces griseocarneus]